jgi:hypothetical protein
MFFPYTIGLTVQDSRSAKKATIDKSKSAPNKQFLFGSCSDSGAPRRFAFVKMMNILSGKSNLPKGKGNE